ncbi:MAG: M20/M25/M40 family metallo-hydrolase [Balneolaceae bacterium]
MPSEPMIKNICFSLFLLFPSVIPLFAQSGSVEQIHTAVTQPDIEMHIRFLAADEFMGRDTGTPQLKVAARYIATRFLINGIKPVPGQEDYYQAVPFNRVFAPREATLAIGDSTYTLEEDLITINSVRGEIEGPVKILEYGSEQELEKADIEGHIVITRAGLAGQSSPQQWFTSSDDKNERLRQHGAIAVIELFDHQQFPWQVLVNFLNQDRLELSEDEENGVRIPHIWLNSTGKSLIDDYEELGSPLEAWIAIQGQATEKVISNNVIGYIEGTDPDLKDEHILLGAHYDHLGVTNGQNEGEDTIYNGARDNGVGIAGILQAAQYLAAHPPRRSVVVAAWTAEEKGLLGSNWFAENPTLPLNRIVYHLNIDGGGYNDTTKVTVIGLERTDGEELLRNAAGTFGLEAIADPVPEQNLFDRSDNVHFARHGIPSPTYSMGLTAFDEEINRYYHRVTDEAQTVNYPYITRYIRSFVLAAQSIANAEEAPFWIEGDPYEQAGLDLYENRH